MLEAIIGKQIIKGVGKKGKSAKLSTKFPKFKIPKFKRIKI